MDKLVNQSNLKQSTKELLTNINDKYLDKTTYDPDDDGLIDKTNVAKKVEGIEESPLFSVYGKSPDGIEGFYEFPIGKIDENTNKFQSVRQDAKANEVYTIDLINDNKLNDLIVQCYEFQKGEQDIVTTLREFNNTDKDNFYYNEDIITFDNGMKINNQYKLNSTLNSDGLYESEIINKSDYLNLIGMEANELWHNMI